VNMDRQVCGRCGDAGGAAGERGMDAGARRGVVAAKPCLRSGAGAGRAAAKPAPLETGAQGRRDRPGGQIRDGAGNRKRGVGGGAWFTGSKNAMKGIGFFLGGLLLEGLGFRGALWAMALALGLILIGVVGALPARFGKARASASARELFSRSRSVNLLVSDAELAARRQAQDAAGWKPAQKRQRKVSAALKAYAKLAMSADKGAVRDLSALGD